MCSPTWEPLTYSSAFQTSACTGHMGLLLKCRFWFTRPGVDPRCSICNKLPGDANPADRVAPPSVVHGSEVSVFTCKLVRKAHSPSGNQKPGDSFTWNQKPWGGLAFCELRRSFGWCWDPLQFENQTVSWYLDKVNSVPNCVPGCVCVIVSCSQVCWGFSRTCIDLRVWSHSALFLSLTSQAEQILCHSG